MRFAEFKTAVGAIDVKNDAGAMLSAFDKAPAHVQQALMNAVTHNPHFIDHIMENGTGAMATLLTPENLNAYGNQIADILNSVANDPNYDFKKFDKLGESAKAYFDEFGKGDKADKEKLAKLQKNLLASVQDAGGNVPAIANLNMEVFMRFLGNFLNGDFEGAIQGLVTDLKLEGKQLAAFNDSVVPALGIMKAFIGQDMIDFVQYHGPRIAAGTTKLVDDVSTLTEGPRVELKPQEERHTAADVAQPTQHAALDTSDMSFNTPAADISGEGLKGVEKISTTGTWDLAANGITPNVTPEQADAVRAYDAETKRLASPALTPNAFV